MNTNPKNLRNFSLRAAVAAAAAPAPLFCVAGTSQANPFDHNPDVWFDPWPGDPTFRGLVPSRSPDSKHFETHSYAMDFDLGVGTRHALASSNLPHRVGRWFHPGNKTHRSASDRTGATNSNCVCIRRSGAWCRFCLADDSCRPISICGTDSAVPRIDTMHAQHWTRTPHDEGHAIRTHRPRRRLQTGWCTTVRLRRPERRGENRAEAKRSIISHAISTPSSDEIGTDSLPAQLARDRLFTCQNGSSLQRPALFLTDSRKGRTKG
jgi:hypothetical protein